METRKILSIIFSIIFLGAFAFVLSWGIINFNKVKDSMSGTQIYDSNDLTNAYEDGYNTALEDKEHYTDLINGYRDTITTLNDNISQLNSQIASLNKTNKDCQNEIDNLNTQKTNLQTEITNLNANRVENLNTIDMLNGRITELNTQITTLQNTVQANETTINGLNDQISSCNTRISSLEETITTNRQTISNLRIEIQNLNSRIETLEQDKTSNLTEISLLNNRITTLTDEITSLTTLNEQYQNTVSELQAEVTILKNEKNNLVLENTNYYNSISSLNNQIVNLQTINTQLENTNSLHLNTIASLNNQITSLNQQINDISLQGQNNNATITSLNNRIKELENSIRYYENYISSLETSSQVVATFEFDGSVYNIQVVNKGSTLSVTNPTSTQYKVFNGWKMNDEFVDLSSYTINNNVKFVADITYKYDVTFVLDGITYDSQIVTKDSYATIPTAPTKTGYAFDGWTVDNVNIVDISTNKITDTTTYTAKFIKIHTVNFIYEDITKSTQSIRNESYASNVTIENTQYKVFNGWKLNGVIVDVSTQKIVSDTTFIADITYKYDVVYKVDNTNYNTQIVTKNNYPTLPTNPVKADYEFDGWSLNGTDVINTSTIQITNNTTYIAVFTKLHTVNFVYEDTTLSTQIVRNNTTATVVNVETTTYKVFNGWMVDNQLIDLSTYSVTKDTTFVASITYKYDVIFMVDDEVYSSQIIAKNTCATVPNNPTKDGYEFDGWTVNGTEIISNINSRLVTENVTYTAKFTKLHTVSFVYENTTKSTQTIRNGNYANNVAVDSTEYKVFNGWSVNGFIVDISSYEIVRNTTFIADITYSYDVKFIVENEEYNSQKITKDSCAILPAEPTKLGYTFSGWTINGTDIVANIDTIPVTENLTYTAIFNKELDFVRVNLNGPSDFDAECVWTDGTDTYYSYFENQYIFDKETNTWVVFRSDGIWEGLEFYLDGRNIWTDGEYVYYSYGRFHYILQKETHKWFVMRFQGLGEFYEEYIWTDGNNIYYSNDSEQYVLDKSISEWNRMTWNGFTPTYAKFVWTDGENTYYSNANTQYVLNKSTNTWEKVSWLIQVSHDVRTHYFDGCNIWTNGENIYYSYQTSHIILNPTTHINTENQFRGLNGFYANSMWTDGENVYCSMGDLHFMYIK